MWRKPLESCFPTLATTITIIATAITNTITILREAPLQERPKALAGKENSEREVHTNSWHAFIEDIRGPHRHGAISKPTS